MRKLILLIFLQLISSILCRQKTNLDWLEPIEMKLKEKEVRYLQKFTTTEEPIEVISLGPDIEIINSTGTIAEMGQFPHYALLFVKKVSVDEWQAVGSSIISPSWILTTASNLYNHHRARVFAGLIDRSNIIEAEYSSGEIYKNSFKIHPDFDETKPESANIAMIKLCRAIHLSLNVDYARLPLNSHKDLQLKDRLATLSGFGDLGDGMKSMFLYYYQQPILSAKACDRKFGDEFDEKQHFCVRTRLGGGGCWGDLGGSLMVEVDDYEYIFGMYFKTGKSCEAGFPSIYVDLRAFLDWIRGTMIERNANVKVPKRKRSKHEF